MHMDMYVLTTAVDYIYDKYFGFTNEEVEELCRKQDKVSMDNLINATTCKYTILDR